MTWHLASTEYFRLPALLAPGADESELVVGGPEDHHPDIFAKLELPGNFADYSQWNVTVEYDDETGKILDIQSDIGSLAPNVLKQALEMMDLANQDNYYSARPLHLGSRRLAIGTGFDEIWKYRVPFVSTPDEDYFGYAGDEHYDIDLPMEAEAQMEGDGREQGHVIFHPEQGEITAWPHDGTGRTPDYLRGDRAEKIKEFARARWEESLNGGWLDDEEAPEDDWRTGSVSNEEGPWQQSGYPNWDTQEVGWALEGNFGYELFGAYQRFNSTRPSQAQFEQWVIQNVIGPYNQEREQEAREWNSVPQHDRLDYGWESLKEENPEAADLVSGINGIFGVPNEDTSDVDLNETLIIESRVDWDLLYRYSLDDFSKLSNIVPGVESWTTPSNTHTQMADPTGNADGLDPTQAPGPRIPCYCDVGLETPHEWAGSCEKGTRPTMQYEAAMGSNWVYIEGQVEFGRHWFQIAQEMLQNMGADAETNSYVTNMLARNTLPTDLDIAIGSSRNGRVQIWESVLDRNAVWDAVSQAQKQQKVATTYEGQDWDGNPQSFDPALTDPNDMRNPVWHSERGDYYYGTADQVMEGDGVRLLEPPRPDLDQSLVVQSVQSMGEQIAISFYPRHVMINNMLGESGLQPDAPQQTPQDEPLLFNRKDAILIRG